MTTMMKYFFFKKLCAHFLLLFRRIQHHFSTSTTLAAPFYLSADDFSPSSTNFHIIHLFWNVSDEMRVRCGMRFIASHPKTRNSHSLCEMCIDGKKCVENRQLIIAGKKYHKISYFLSRFIFVMVRMFREELRGEWDGGKKGFFIARHRWKGNPFFFDECLKRVSEPESSHLM